MVPLDVHRLNVPYAITDVQCLSLDDALRALVKYTSNTRNHRCRFITSTTRCRPATTCLV